MTDDLIDIETMWPDRYAPTWSLLEKATTEDPFGEASFELLKEAGVHSTLVSALIPKIPYERNDAILCALVVKAAKLAKGIIAMTAHLGADRQLALIRELLEELSTLHYLLNDTGDGKRFDQYIYNSLIIEKGFVEKIKSNVSKRSRTLVIEESMMRSIERTAKAAGIDNVNSIPSRKAVGWPNAESLIAELNSNLYLAYRSGSGVIHTQWDDLLRNHLVQLPDGRFEPNYDDTPPRPQPLYGAGLLLVLELQEYLHKKRPDAFGVFEKKLLDLHQRLIKVTELHSNFLDKR